MAARPRNSRDATACAPVPAAPVLQLFVPQKPVSPSHDYFLWPEPRGYFRWPRRGRLFLEIGIGVLIVAAIAIGTAVNLPRWLETLGWAAWIVWMILLCILGVQDWNIRRRHRRLASPDHPR